MQYRIIGRDFSFLSHFLSFSFARRKLYGGERGAGVRVWGFGAPRDPPRAPGCEQAEAGTSGLASPSAGGGRNLCARVAVGGRRRAVTDRSSSGRVRAVVAGC